MSCWRFGFVKVISVDDDFVELKLEVKNLLILNTVTSQSFDLVTILSVGDDLASLKRCV